MVHLHPGRLALMMLTLALLVSTCAPKPLANLTPSPALATRQPTPPPTGTPTPAPSPAGTRAPINGGQLTIPLLAEPRTLDEGGASRDEERAVLRFLGASLVARDPQDHIAPFLAASWESTTDGLAWTFHLRPGIRFQDGTPCTAYDFQYTFQRLKQSSALYPIHLVDATDDLTVRVFLSSPDTAILYTLSDPTLFSPLSKDWVDRHGGDISHHPMSVGPYKLKEWVGGDHLTLERTPDYNWGPAYAHAGPAYIETIVFPFIPDSSTILAGLESGQLDAANIDPPQVERIRSSRLFNVYAYYYQGANPILAFNVSRPPFDYLPLRIAFNMAIDRQSVIDLLLNGSGLTQYGPLSISVPGYWPDVETSGYNSDPERARELLAQAGYSPGPDGILTRLRQPPTYGSDLPVIPGMRAMPTPGQSASPEPPQSQALRLDLWAPAGDTRLPAILKAQFKDLGIELDVQQLEPEKLREKLLSGDYQLALTGYSAPDPSQLYDQFYSGLAGITNYTFDRDPALDAILTQVQSAADQNHRHRWVDEAQQYITEQALIAPILTPQIFIALSKRVSGVTFSTVNGMLYWEDAYMQGGR